MKYTVKVLERAQRDVDLHYEWIAKRDLVGAERWYRAYLEAMRTLEIDPYRFALAAEAPVVRRHMGRAVLLGVVEIGGLIVFPPRRITPTAAHLRPRVLDEASPAAIH